MFTFDMNLKNKFSIAVISLAAYIQAQDLQVQVPVNEEPDAVPAVESAVPEVPPSEAALQSDPAESTNPPVENAPEESVSEAPAIPAPVEENAAPQVEPASDNSQETSLAETTEVPASSDSVAEAAADQAPQAQQAIDLASVESSPAPTKAETQTKSNTTKTKAKKKKHAKKYHSATVHGSAYNIVNNEAADATVRSDMAMPHKMIGSRYGYFEPVNGFGIAAFGSSNTYFLAFDNSDKLGLVTAGAAFGNFGASLRFAIGKNWYKAYLEDIGDYQENNTTSSGTLFGATASTKILGADLGVDVAYSNTDNQQFTSSNLDSEGIYSWDFTGKLTLASSYYHLFSWSASISLQRYQATRTSRTVIYSTPFGGPITKTTWRTTVTDTTSHVTVTPEFNIGSNILKSPKSKLYIGLNTAIPMTAYDRISGIVSRHNEYSLQFTPNILGEVELGKYVMAFGSASYLWTAYEMRDSYKGTTGVKAYNSVSGTTTANIGMKFHMEYAALELAFTNDFISNPFSSFGSVNDIGFSIGAFINFP